MARKDSKTPQRRQSYERDTDAPTAITPVEYGGLQEAYDHFSRTLFGNQLPDVFITYQRKAGMAGHFAAERYSGRVGKFAKDELALNPDGFIGQSDKQICQTLVHEMHHVWQMHRGSTPPKQSNYHNKEWAAKMKANGLQPSSTGMVGGKETGQRMSDYIIPGGKFEQAYDQLAATSWRLNLQSAHRPGPKDKEKDKSTFICVPCKQTAYGKPSLAIICELCGAKMRDRDAMVADPSRDPLPPAKPSIPSYQIDEPPIEPPAKPKRGRPRGSKRKPKIAFPSYDAKERSSGFTA